MLPPNVAAHVELLLNAMTALYCAPAEASFEEIKKTGSEGPVDEVNLLLALAQDVVTCAGDTAADDVEVESIWQSFWDVNIYTPFKANRCILRV